MSDRRLFLVHGGAAVLALANGRAALGAPAFASAIAPSPRACEVGAGVFLVRGAAGEFGPGNLGRVGNAGFIVGRTGVVAIDTGTSYRHGVALLQEIARITSLPVRSVLVTHARQAFVFGALAYRERGIPVHMHAKAAALMRSRCEGCLKTLHSVLGDAEMARTGMFTPDVMFDNGHSIALEARPIQVLYFGRSSGPGDIAVRDLETGVLFAGGLLDEGRIPDIADSDLEGWKHAMMAIRALSDERMSVIVPGHGPAGTTAVIDNVERYLHGLEARVRQILKQGASLSEVADLAAWPEIAHWDQYTTIHRRNASILYLRLEAQ